MGFEQTPNHAKRIILTSPVLSPLKFVGLMNADSAEFRHITLSMAFEPAIGLQQAVVDLAEQAIQTGHVILVLSDKQVSEDQLLIPSAMATGAVHHRLVKKGLRTNGNIVVETGDARDPHQFAVLLGFGATAVYPWLAYNVLTDLHRSGELLGDPLKTQQNYRKAIRKGLHKVMSKMGISTVTSYRGSQLFEAIGLSREVSDLCFSGVTSRIGGATFADFEEDLQLIRKNAWKVRKNIEQGGSLKYVHGGEYHAYNPEVIQSIQEAVQTNSQSAYDRFASLVNERPVATLRDLLSLRKDIQPIDITEVEPVEKLFPRFDTAAISLGALSPEAHEALAEAMNELGGRSNSGEGGEDAARYGTLRNSN